MAAQIGLEFGGRQRLGIEVALRLLALLVQEERRLRGRLHALRDHFEAEIVRHRDQRAHDRGVAGVVGDLADEAAVDLDPRQREARQIAERRIAGAEIVECELDAAVVNLLQHGGVAEVERDVLGDLELQRLGAAGRSSRSASSRSCSSASSPNWVGNRLTAIRLRCRPCARQSGGLGAGGVDDPAADLGRDRARGQRVDEGAGREDAGDRMAPAHQRLGADHGAVGEPDLRLEIQLELVLRIGAAQLEIEASPRLRLRAQHRQEEPIGRAGRPTSPGRAQGRHWRSARRRSCRRWARSRCRRCRRHAGRDR